MKNVAALAIAFLFSGAAMLIAKPDREARVVYLATSFNFTDHPACGSDLLTNCVKSIRFYDADSRRSLGEVETMLMTGQQSIVGAAKVAAIPQRVYAVTVYVDALGRLREGPHGEISKVANAVR